MRSSFSKPMRVVMLMAFLAVLALLCAPAALAQKGCAAFYIPAGPEWGNWNAGIWYSEGPVLLGHEALYVKISVQSLTGFPRGKTGNTWQGTESAIYDFGNNDTFQTIVSFVSEHSNDPDKMYFNAVETIVSGTGRFAGATGRITDHGPSGFLPGTPSGFLPPPATITVNGITAPPDGWAYLTSAGAICGVGPAS